MEILIYVLPALASIFVLFGFVAIFAGPRGWGAPFVPSSRERVLAMLRVAGDVRGKRIADLGSGDGRVVVAFASAGAEAHGYELNPVLVWWSRISILLRGLGARAHVHLGSYWKKDISHLDLVVVFGFPPMMGELEKKLRRELRPGARVLSNSFVFPTWKNVKKEDGIYVYEQTDIPL